MPLSKALRSSSVIGVALAVAARPAAEDQSENDDEDLAKVQAGLRRDERGCLVWTGSVNSTTGRPRVWLGGKYVTVYVWLWQREYGSVPSGWTRHHGCRNPLCCELDHLTPKTRGDNAALG